jgi:S1-C subfamily serine protease
MSGTSTKRFGRSRRGTPAWWLATILLALGLLVALIVLQLREPETIVRLIPSTQSSEPTPDMLAQVEQLDIESADLNAEVISLLRFVANYECPPGTIPGDVERLENLKRKAEAMLAGTVGGRSIGRITSPSEIPDPAPAATGETTTLPISELSTLLETAAVFILSFTNDSLAGSGTGFFIGPDLIVTNRHVIEGGDPSRVLITSAVLGDVVQARVVAQSPKGKAGAPDFALLRTDRKVAPGTLTLTGQHSKLMDVLAAGYPGMALGSDSGFLALARGDRTAAPDMHQNSGEIRSTQGHGKTTSILHTADVQTGYSGGPLIDLCGRVVGINTFIQVDSSQSAKFNSALAADGIHVFLKQTDTPHAYDNRSCDPG